MSEEFEPDWASPPGDTILDLMAERQLNLNQLAGNMGICAERLNELIEGVGVVNGVIALKLSHALGSTPQFWLRRESQYRKSLARLAKW